MRISDWSSDVCSSDLTNAPPWSFAECSNERPSSITTTRAPAPHSDAQSSCRVTDLPDTDLPNTATLWLPAAFSHGLQKNGWPRRPISLSWGTGPARTSPWKGGRKRGGEGRGGARRENQGGR